MQARAAILRSMGLERPYSASKPLVLTDVEVEGPGPGEVLLSMRAAGLCHSDLSVIDGNRPRLMPMVLGHEGAGVVEALGPGVHDLAVGDHVVTTFVPACGACGACDGGRPALCEPALAANLAGTLLSGAKRLHVNGADIHHHLGVSAFATAATVARNSVVRIDRTLPFEHAAVFGCAVITGVGAVVNTAALPPEKAVAIVGLGGVGLAALLGARLRQASVIVALDLSPGRLALARELGATHTLDASAPDCIERVREATRGGVDYSFEMAGAIPAMELAYTVTRRGGTTVTAGLPHVQARFAINHSSLVLDERTIKGSYLGSCVPARDIPRYIEWYQAGRLPVDRLLGERLAFDDINAGFDRLARGEGGRQVVVF
jgi:alcohol dehydrogenase